MRRRIRRAARPSVPSVGRVRRQPEKVEQTHIVGLLWTLCGKDAVWVTGVHRRKGDHQGTMMTPSLPDVLAFLPRALGLLFVEAKAARGRMSDEQQRFRNLALAVHENGGRVYHVTGGLNAVLVQLVALNLVRADSVPHYRIAQERDEPQPERVESTTLRGTDGGGGPRPALTRGRYAGRAGGVGAR